MLAAEIAVSNTLSLAGRIRALRIERGWSQNELALQAELKPATYRLFEQTGQISLLRLVQVLAALDRLQDLEELCAPRFSAEDLERPVSELLLPPRQRAGRKKHQPGNTPA